MVSDWPLNEAVFDTVTIKTHDGEHILNEAGKTYLIRVNGSFIAVIRQYATIVGDKTDRVFFFPANDMIHVEGVVKEAKRDRHLKVGIASE